MYDKIIDMPVVRLFKPFLASHKELILYLFFGGLSFLVSIGTFVFFANYLKINELISNILSWVITVLFAFMTNRKWVFADAKNSKMSFTGQLFSFYLGRVATLVVEEIILFAFVSVMHFDGVIVKIIAQIIVIILNYIISKIWVFKKNDSE